MKLDNFSEVDDDDDAEIELESEESFNVVSENENLSSSREQEIETFSSTVYYKYTLSEVAFLIFKLYKMLKIRFNIDLRANHSKTEAVIKENRINLCVVNETQDDERKRKASLKALEKIQETQLQASVEKSAKIREAFKKSLIFQI